MTKKITLKSLNINVTKADNHLEKFSAGKFEKSLLRAGLNLHQSQEILKSIESELYEGISTKKLHKLALKKVKKINKQYSSKYNLKDSLRALGPTGFPFEKLVSQILMQEGYSVKVDQILRGTCITHEIDIIAIKNKKTLLVEAKFHNEFGYKTNVRVPLYTKARFDDIWATNKYKIDSSMIVTNTKFTTDAISYGECMSMVLLAWGYPKNRGIDYLINKYNVYPITTLTSLNRVQKRMLIDAGIITCKDLETNLENLKNLNLDINLIKSLKNECSALHY